MGKKSSKVRIPAEIGQAMQKQADVAEQQQNWMENEMFPWLQEQADIITMVPPPICIGLSPNGRVIRTTRIRVVRCGCVRSIRPIPGSRRMRS